MESVNADCEHRQSSAHCTTIGAGHLLRCMADEAPIDADAAAVEADAAAVDSAVAATEAAQSPTPPPRRSLL
jgi:hypothetical protein